MSSAPSDAELMAAHITGDPDAFPEIVRRHQDRMWAVALRTVRDPEEAADALQDAFVSAFRSADRFRGQSQVGTWLHRIVVNACLDRIRRRRARPTVPLEQVFPEPPTGDEFSRRETSLVIAEALATLPDDQREAIVLVDVHGYPVAQAARLLGAAEGTVKSRCARGRLKLAGVLGHLRNPDAPADVSCSARANRSRPRVGTRRVEER